MDSNFIGAHKLRTEVSQGYDSNCSILEDLDFNHRHSLQHSDSSIILTDRSLLEMNLDENQIQQRKKKLGFQLNKVQEKILKVSYANTSMSKRTNKSSILKSNKKREKKQNTLGQLKKTTVLKDITSADLQQIHRKDQNIYYQYLQFLRQLKKQKSKTGELDAQICVLELQRENEQMKTKQLREELAEVQFCIRNESMRGRDKQNMIVSQMRKILMSSEI